MASAVEASSRQHKETEITLVKIMNNIIRNKHALLIYIKCFKAGFLGVLDPFHSSDRPDSRRKLMRSYMDHALLLILVKIR